MTTTGFGIARRQLLTGAVCYSIAASSGLAAAQPLALGPVQALAALLERDYPDPEIARRLARNLRRSLQSGKYFGLAKQVLAERLTADIRAIASDQHLKVYYDPKDAAIRTPATAAPKYEPYVTPRAPSAKAREIFAPQGYGLTKVALLPGNVGLIQIDNFVPLYDLVKSRFGDAMTLLADSFALIVDLRNNGGGTTDTPAWLLSYFYDRPPFVLNRIIWRNAPEERIVIFAKVEGPKYGEKRPVAVLTSAETFSAAEAVAYSLQSTKRAIVVGERSRGGANPGDFFNLGDGFVAFTPQGRAIDTVTGGNWEGVGVEPNISTSRENALAEAHRALISQAVLQASDADTQQILREGLKQIPLG